MSVIFYVLLSIFSVLGIWEFLRIIIFWCCTPKVKKKIVIYPISGDSADLELLARSVHQQEQWDYRQQDAEIILVDCGLEQEAIRIAKLLCRDLEGFTFCKWDECGEIINQKLKNSIG